MLIDIGRLDPPGAISPVSSDPSFKTTRCVMLSTFCHTTVCPAGKAAGFGEKDCAPLMATTLIVTIPLGGVGVGDGVGAGAGVGVGVGAGVAGVGDSETGPTPESVEPP